MTLFLEAMKLLVLFCRAIFHKFKKTNVLKKMNIDKKHGGNIDYILLICLS